MNYRILIVAGFAAGLFSNLVCAKANNVTPSHAIVTSHPWHWVGTLSGGMAWENAGETQTFYLVSETEKTYVAYRQTHRLGVGELFVGGQKQMGSFWQAQLGLAVATAANAQLQGIIWDDADPQFDNYSYSYKVRHTHLNAKAKLIFDRYWLMPWLSGSFGAGFNYAYHFNNTPLIFEAEPNANFADKTVTAFNYTLGAGIQKNLDTHWQVGIGYEFADWGKSELARAPDQTLNSGLKLNHLRTNGFLVNLTYVA